MTGKPHRILLVTRNFPPLIGGMERLIYNVYLELAKESEMALLGPHGCAEYVKKDDPVFSCRLSPTFAFLACFQLRAYQITKAFKPDLIVAGSGVAAPAAVYAAGRTNIPVVCYLHGLDIVARHFLYKKLFIPAIRRCDTLIVNSNNTARLASEAGIVNGVMRVLQPGVSIPGSVASPNTRNFREAINAGNGPILLSVGRLHKRKGLAEFIRDAMPRLVARHRDILLLIIGAEPGRALKGAGGELQRIKSAAELAGVGKNILMLGSVDEQTLGQAYRESDLLVFPVRAIPGDVEGFGMVAIEAAAHGLPTVAFSAGGVPDAIKPGVSGYLVSPGDYAGFGEIILHYLQNEDPEIWCKHCIEHARSFSWEIFGRRLRDICRETVAIKRMPSYSQQ